MKMWILLAILFQLTKAFGGGVTIGNGGDVLPSERLSLPEIEALVGKSKDVLSDVFNVLDLEVSDSQYTGKSPTYYKKLFGKEGNLLKATRGAVIQAHADAICLGLDGLEKDGSADVDSSSICINLQRLHTKVTKVEAPVKIIALVAHELSHLAGTTEAEADDFQTRIESILLKDSLDQWQRFNSFIRGYHDFIQFIFKVTLMPEIQDQDWSAACSSLSISDKSLQGLLPKIDSFARFNSKTYNDIAFTYLQNKVSQAYVCKKAGIEIEQMDQAALDIIFEQDVEVYFDEVAPEPLILLGIVYDLPKDHKMLVRIQSDEELLRTISNLTSNL